MLHKIHFNKKIWQCIVIIELLILVGTAFLYRQSPVEMNYTQDDLVYESGESGFYLDATSNGNYITTPEFTLPKGLYFLDVQCEYLNSHVTSVNLQYSDEGYESNITDDTTSTFRVKYSDRPMRIKGRLTSEASDGDYLLIRNINIVSSPLDMRNTMFHLTILFLIVDLIVLFFSVRHKIYISEELQAHIKVLLFLIVISSIPLMVNYLENLIDLEFHLMRIEGLKAGLMDGVFPVRIQPYWLNGHGYAVSVFYGDIFLYIPAVLRVFGVSIQTAYRFYVVLINAMTVLISYHCFRGMSSNAKAGLVCTIVYTLNLYRLSNIYTRGAVGEYTAMTFIPLVMYGLWKVYMLPENSKEHQNSWFTIAVGCCGIFFSHMITTEMTAIFVIITAVVLWKKTFRKKTFLVLVKATAMIVLLTGWFMIPFLDYMMSGNYVINNPDYYVMYSMENTGIFPAQLFMMDYDINGIALGEIYGVASKKPLTVGLSAMFVLAGWLFLCTGKKERDISEKKTEYFAVILCVLSLWMATNLFPYTWLANKVSILRMPISNIQFSWRFLTIAGAMLVYLLCLILQKKWIVERKMKLFAGLLVGFSVLQGLYFISQCLNVYPPLRVYQAENLSNIEIGNGEYLPMNDDIVIDAREFRQRLIEECVDQITYEDSAVSVSDWHRDKGVVEVSLTNNGNEVAQVEVPLLLYKGYHAIADSGDELAITAGTSSRISVSVPAGFAGDFRVEFREPWYWRMCEVISLMTLLVLILYSPIKNYVYKKQKTDGICEI